MAKTTKTEAPARFVEDLKFRKVSVDDILFWDFTKHKTIVCEIVGEEKLEYDVYKVREFESKKLYYIPKHKKIVEAVEENGEKGVYKIVHIATTSFGRDKKKTFNSYEVLFAE